MRLLFVHGMGRTPLSGWPMLRQLKRAGHDVETFAYVAGVESFARIERRLVDRVAALAMRGDYAVIGHSLGGVLLRAALWTLPDGAPRPDHLFLLGSPMRAPLLARQLQRNAIYRLLTGECGQLLASPERMAAIAPPGVPTTVIAGVRGIAARGLPFRGEVNDGVVLLAEVVLPDAGEPLQVPVAHTWLPASARVAALIIETLARRDGA